MQSKKVVLWTKWPLKILLLAMKFEIRYLISQLVQLNQLFFSSGKTDHHDFFHWGPGKEVGLCLKAMMYAYIVCSTAITIVNTLRGLWGGDPQWRVGSLLCLRLTSADGVRWQEICPCYSNSSPISSLYCFKLPHKYNWIHICVTHHP